MAMPLAAPRYTIADLERFPEDGNRYELLGGVLLVTPSAGAPHQLVLGDLNLALAAYLAPAGLATIVTPGAIQHGSDTQLEPDLLVVPARFRRVASWRQMSDWWLAVEVSGRASRIYDRDFKTAAYLRLGVREVWRVDLRDRIVYVSRPGAPQDVPQVERLLWHPQEMPAPLEINVRTLFR
jgi:Uma2 family endonuclease